MLNGNGVVARLKGALEEGVETRAGYSGCRYNAAIAIIISVDEVGDCSPDFCDGFIASRDWVMLAPFDGIVRGGVFRRDCSCSDQMSQICFDDASFWLPFGKNSPGVAIPFNSSPHLRIFCNSGSLLNSRPNLMAVSCASSR